jgi:putative oxidoreductase
MMTRAVPEAFDPYREWNTVLVRLALALPLVIHGLGKLGVGPAGPGSVGAFAGFLTSLGVPAASLFAWIVTIVEVVGGLAILLGIFTRYAAALVAIDMAVATVLVHVKNGYLVSDGGFELTLTLFLLSVALVLVGNGRHLSLERALFETEH